MVSLLLSTSLPINAPNTPLFFELARSPPSRHAVKKVCLVVHCRPCALVEAKVSLILPEQHSERGGWTHRRPTLEEEGTGLNGGAGRTKGRRGDR